MWVICCAMAVIFAEGCSDSNQKTTEYHYSDDGYMGNSTANPGILTSPNSRTYGRDTETIHAALKQVPHIRKSMVHYRGGTAIIRLRVDGSLSPDGVEAVRNDALRILSFSMPRYTIEVKAYQ